MKATAWCLVGWLGLMVCAAAAQRPRMVVFDQDTAGPAGTDLDSLLMLLQSPDVQLLGVTVVAGDGWRADEVAHALRLLEIVGRTSVPVVPGAAGPLLRTRAATAAWEKAHGAVAYQGMWTNWPQGPGGKLPEGRPTLTPSDEDAAHFLVRIVNAHPHQVTIIAAGPMTNLAQALRLDPHFAERTAGLVFMGGSLGPPSHDAQIMADPVREFNFWFDPDAAHAVLRAHWPSLTDTTQDVSIQTHFTQSLKVRLAALHTPAAQYVVRYTDVFGNIPYMWDELAVGAWLDPTLITRSMRVYLDVDVDAHSRGWGDTEHFALNAPHDATLQPVTAQLQVNVAKFQDEFVALLGKAPTH